jgi:gluconate 2-dehydrogenase subunit 3-like protein
MNDEGKRPSGWPLIGRRKWLQSLVIGGTLAAIGGAVAWIRTGGYVLDPEIRGRLRVLAPWEFIVVRDVARRMVAPDRSSGVITPDEVGVASFVDRYLEEMRPALRHDVLRMLRFVEQLAPFTAGLLSRFTELSPGDQDGVLASLESSGVDQLRAGFQALKGLVMMGYYSDARTFGILGYKGPLISLPEDPQP